MSGYVPNPPKNYRYSGVEPVDTHAQRWAEYKDLPSKKDTKPNTIGCVFAKSCDLPDGVIDHKTPAGFIPVEKVANFGDLPSLVVERRTRRETFPSRRSAVLYRQRLELSC